uniref:Uncharacterized protein n=1 Tax=Daphnia galeata TaxID=27404 RepID=A0A8J2WHK6_9CRUS|nr:unnamed protein product [Daphnia galeata]
MQFVPSSYLDKQLHPEERIYRIWFVVFSVRLWRYWICCDKMYTLSENFVTLNCYLSAEINAHCFVLAILELSDRPEDFKPWHISSQPAESYFRSARSVSSSGSTKVNFTARECFVTRFARVDAHIALTAKGAKYGLNFLRFTRVFEDTRNHPGFAMPGIEQINKTIM